MRVLGPSRLVFADYPGNRMFNTLGNLAVYPGAGLLFMDFAAGDLLQLTGRARVEPDFSVVFQVDEVRETLGGSPLRFELVDYSPANPPAVTGGLRRHLKRGAGRCRRAGAEMTKQIACSDVVPGCAFTASAPTNEELLKKVEDHAAQEHRVKEVTPELAAKVKTPSGAVKLDSMDVPPADPSDETLAARAAAGDEAAFEEIVTRYQARVFRLAWRLTGSEDDAADALQEAFLQVYRGLAGFSGESRFGTWLYRVATNAALMLRRARSRRPAESLEAYLPRFDAAGVHVGTAAELQVAARADQMLDLQVLAQKARAGIERLPDLYREAFVLRDLEEMPTEEVALILGLEPAAVRQRVHRARLMLRGFLSDLAGVKP